MKRLRAHVKLSTYKTYKSYIIKLNGKYTRQIKRMRYNLMLRFHLSALIGEFETFTDQIARKM